MSPRQGLRVCGCLILALACGLSPAAAQLPGKHEAGGRAGGTDAKVKRIVYDVKQGVAKDLAAVLGKLFKSDADVQVLVAPGGNALVLGGPTKAVDEILHLLQKLDRRPRAVAIEVLVAEVFPRKAEAGKPAPPAAELDEREFSGDRSDVLAKLENLKKKGMLGSLQRLFLTTTENQPGSVSNSKSQPYTTGFVSRGGVGSRSISYRNVGTQVKATPSIGHDHRVLLDLDISAARMHIPEDGTVLGTDDGKPVRATEFVTARFEGRLLLSSGQAVAAKGVTTKSRSGHEQTLVIVSARLIEPGAKEAK
jgi:hypothetical protein